ncbi:reverse transcriptase domain-containing protein [Tanacetum coccineum]
MDKKQNGKRKDKGTTLGDLAKRVKNIDGKIMGKDEDVSNAADVEDVAADMREWDTFVNNHSHVHVLEVADVTKGVVDDTPSRKLSISPIVSIHEFEIEQDTLDETMMNTQHLGDGLVADKRTPTYAAIVNPMSSPNTFNTPPLKSFNSVLNPTNDVEGLDAGTIKMKVFSNILSPNRAADVGGSEVTDMDVNDTPNGSPTMALASCENLQNSERVYFRSLLNDVNVESYDYVLPQTVADVVKSRLQNLMKTDDGVFMFKFASKEGLEKVLQRGPWMIRKSPIILTKWSPNLSLKKGEVTCVPVWVKLHGVPILAFSGDGLSLISTQIVTVPNVPSKIATEATKSDGFTEVKRKNHKGKKADMQPRSRQIDGPSTLNSFDALNTMNVEDKCGTSSSRGNLEEEQVEGTKESHLNEHVESDEEVDEFIFPEGDKFGDKFDIRLKGRVRK